MRLAVGKKLVIAQNLRAVRPKIEAGVFARRELEGTNFIAILRSIEDFHECGLGGLALLFQANQGDFPVFRSGHDFRASGEIRLEQVFAFAGLEVKHPHPVICLKG